GYHHRNRSVSRRSCLRPRRLPLREQISRQVLQPRVHRHGRNATPGSKLTRDLTRGEDVESSRHAPEDAFLLGKTTSKSACLVLVDRACFVVIVAREVGRYK